MEHKDDPWVISTARKFWGIEWALSQIHLMKKPVVHLQGLPIEQLKNALEVITAHDPPTVQMLGGPSLAMVHVFLVKPGNQFQSHWMTLEGILLKVQRLRYLLQNLRISAEAEDETFLDDLRALSPNMQLIVNYPIAFENLVEAKRLTLTRVPRTVERVRVCAGFYQMPDGAEQWINTDLQPAWGEAARIWERMYWNRSNSLVRDIVAEYPLSDRYLETMDNKTIISWNVRGAARRNFRRGVSDLVNQYNPNVLIMTETRVGKDRAHRYLRGLPFDKWFATETLGFRGGIWVAWNSATIELAVISSTVQEVHALVRSHNSSDFCLLSAIYASPRFEERKILWDNLKRIADNHRLDWLMMGDFNELLSNSEKRGGRPISQHRANLFRDCLNYCDMLDLGFTGPKFTWTNVREIGGLIQERLDRACGNQSWVIKYPAATVLHLPRTGSDHCPVLLTTSPQNYTGHTKPFRFETMWMSHPDFPHITNFHWLHSSGSVSLKTKNFTDALHVWNQRVFGNIFKRKRKLLSRMSGLEKALADHPSHYLLQLHKNLSLQYQTLLQQEEDFWKQKSRLEWQAQGDRNTKFFHTSTIIRRKRNRIDFLENSQGNMNHDFQFIKESITEFFTKTLTTNSVSSTLSTFLPGGWNPPPLLHNIPQVVSDLQIQQAISSIKPL